VTDGKSFTDRETADTIRKVELASPTALTYRQVNTDKQGRYRITKTYVTDPARATLLVSIRFQALDRGDYKVYALYDPSLANSGRHDSGATQDGALVASDSSGSPVVASALAASRPFLASSSGHDGTSDGWTDLKTDHVMDWTNPDAAAGNLVQTARLALGGKPRSSRLTLALGFGESRNSALATARASLSRPFGAVRATYNTGWGDYLDGLDAAPGAVTRDSRLLQQYRVAVMVLKAHEDKTYQGANIASLTIPWGEAVNADEAGVGGYHLVWARDLYEVATAQLAAGDSAAANRSLDYLFDVQQKPDGSFPQNSLLDGTPYWGGLQLDEVAFPIVLAWQLHRTDATTYAQHVKKAAEFIVAHGPATPQERWEEEGGYSPSTIAAEIAGLTAAADIARQNGDTASQWLFQGVADLWQRNVESWTFTTTGPLGDDQLYFERIDDNGNPDDGHTLDINNGGGSYDERSIVDAGFLELVRLGVKPFDDPHITGSLPEVDATISVDTPNGRFWYRYNHDGYGEKADGAPYDGTGVGRLWPILSGERGEYTLAAGGSADSYLRAMAAAANQGYLIPEQVWDSEEPTAFGFVFGEGTGSATPLAWSMAQFVRLAKSIQAGAPVETPDVVADRYATGQLPASPSLTVTSPTEGTVTGAATIQVSGSTDGEHVYINSGGTTAEVPVVGGSFSYDAPLYLGSNTITVVAVSADGGTAAVQRTVTSTNFGAQLGTFVDPAGDDNGPGSYVYPANDAFNAGAFDITRFGVYDDGRSYNFVTTIAGEVRNPWGGNQISVQRVNVYVRTGSGGGTVPALPGTNAQLAAPYDWVVTGDGFNDLGVRDASGATVSGATMLALPATNQIIVSVPKEVFGSADLGAASFSVEMLSHAGDGEGTGHVRPVYELGYWQSTAGTDMSWIHDYRFGGGAGMWTGDTDARDTDTSDPNVIDLLVGAGDSQQSVLDWTSTSPVTLPYVQLA
jgi:glucoamylase